MLAWSFGAAVAAEEPKEGVVEGSFVRLTEQKVGEREHLAIVVQPAGSEVQVTVLVPNRQTDQGQWVRAPELAAAARRLRAGQKLRLVWVADAGQKFVRRIQAEGLGEGERPWEAERRREGDRPREGERRPAERREGDRPREGERRPAERREGDRPREGERERPAELRELAQQIRAMRVAMERMQRQIDQLRQEVRRLKGEKPERPAETEVRRDKPAEAQPKPEAPRE
ncbi:MAG: hypothetical protein AMJ81_03565 [Phycisphaerae bacterium SM23_33]|jgi:hypothetical protein|nr:MAG: hypothetical protein AMJ81_03565 [Phycisphaerae bacterium SM23_33]